MLDAHEKYANMRINTVPKLVIASVKQKKSFVLSYKDDAGFIKTFKFDNYVPFFAMVELLNTANRKFTYEIIDTSYVITR